MVPLENFLKSSLIHKDYKINDKVQTNTATQEAPPSALASASLTVEAALVFPLFLLALVAVLFFFRVLEVGHMTSGALAATGGWLSLEAREEEEPVAKAVGYFQKELLGKSFPDDYVVGGRAGITFGGSTLDGDYVDLKIRYTCKLPLTLFGLNNIPISQRVRMKKWTGYHKEAAGGDGTEEQIVYITPTGTVYHTSMDCTHLKLSTRTMGKEETLAEGYEPCSFCGKKPGIYGYYYVTTEGRKYHTQLSCSGLKRTIYMVRISEAEGRSACGRCGGK